MFTLIHISTPMLLILHFYVKTNSREIRMTNISEVIGTNDIKLRCSYTTYPNDRVSGVFFFAANVSDNYVHIAESTVFSSQPELLPYGVYLFGSANITKLSDSPSEVVLTFDNLKCKQERNYKCILGIHNALPTESAPMQLFVQVPPSKPDNIVMINTPIGVSTTTAEARVLNSTALDNEKVKSQLRDNTRTTPLYNFDSSIVNDNTASPTLPYNVSISYNSVQQLALESSIMEGNTLTVKCSGNVGKPSGIFTLQVLRNDNIQSTIYDTTTTEIEEIPGNCSYYRTSYLTFEVTSEDNQAVIRCAVLSPLAEQDMYIDSEQLEVKYNVRMPTVTKYPDNQEYIAGVDNSITLMCTSDGNPKPIFSWYKDNQYDIISTDGTFTITDMNTTNSGLYICYVTNTITDHTFTKAAQIEVIIINEENKTKSTTSRTTCSNKKELQNDNTAVVVVGTVCGSIILVLSLILFAIIQNKKKTLICPCHDRSEDYFSTTHQHEPSLYEGVSQALDVHDYGQLSTREHQYTNTNFSSS